MFKKKINESLQKMRGHSPQSPSANLPGMQSATVRATEQPFQ